MSDYLVTDIELTSIANAIRTKGGTSASLEFPTDFVSAIGAIPTGITPTGTIPITTNGTVDVTNYAYADINVSGGGALDWLGQGTELVSVIYPVTTTYLKDTSFHGWTPTTSSKTIKAAEETKQVTLDLENYDYTIRWDVNINLFYSSSNAWEQEFYACVGFTSVFRRPNDNIQLATQSDAYNDCVTQAVSQFSKGLNGSSNDWVWFATNTTSQRYGFYATPQTATISYTSITSLPIKFKTPTIICRCASTYLTTASAQLINENTSNFKIKGTLYRCPRRNSYTYKAIHEAVIAANNPMT